MRGDKKGCSSFTSFSNERASSFTSFSKTRSSSFISFSKVGAMHIEIVISFALFILFVTFLLFYIKPYNQSAVSDSSLIGIHDSFVRYSVVNLTTTFLYADATSCFSVNLANIEPNSVSVVKTLEKDNVNSYYNPSGQLSIVPSGNYFRIYLSSDLQTSGFTDTCVTLPTANFTFGSYDKSEVISYKKLQEIKNNYTNNYDNLRRQLNVPPNFDFGVYANLSTEEYLLQKSIPEEAKVYARAYMQRVMFTTGEVENVEFIFKLW